MERGVTRCNSGREIGCGMRIERGDRWDGEVEASRSGNEVGARVGPEIVARPTPGSTTGKYMYADGKRHRLCGMLNFAGY